MINWLKKLLRREPTGVARVPSMDEVMRITHEATANSGFIEKRADGSWGATEKLERLNAAVEGDGGVMDVQFIDGVPYAMPRVDAGVSAATKGKLN